MISGLFCFFLCLFLRYSFFFLFNHARTLTHTYGIINLFTKNLQYKQKALSTGPILMKNGPRARRSNTGSRCCTLHTCIHTLPSSAVREQRDATTARAPKGSRRSSLKIYKYFYSIRDIHFFFFFVFSVTTFEADEFLESSLILNFIQARHL